MTSDTEPLRILHFEARAFCRLRFVSFDPAAGAVVISGPNAQGKTSILRAIEVALLGKRADPEAPVRTGEESADVGLVIGTDGAPLFKVSRHFEADGSPAKLEIRDVRTGVKRGKPMQILGDLFDAIAFDPLEFIHPPGVKTPEAVRARQVEQLLQICPVSIDLEENARTRAAAFTERTDVGRALREAEAATLAIEVPDAPASRVPVLELVAERDQLRAQIEGKRRAESLLAAATHAIEELEERLERARGDLEKIRAQHSSVLEVDAPALAKTVDAISARIAKSEETNALVERRASALERSERAAARVAMLRERVRELSEEIERRDRERTDAIAGAKFPVPGLGLDAGGVTLVGPDGSPVPLSQASFAQQLGVSFSLAMARNPRLRVALIRDGNALDARSFAALEKLAEDRQFQVFVERVAEDQIGAIVIEDGEIAGRVS